MKARWLGIAQKGTRRITNSRSSGSRRLANGDTMICSLCPATSAARRTGPLGAGSGSVAGEESWSALSNRTVPRPRPAASIRLLRRALGTPEKPAICGGNDFTVHITAKPTTFRFALVHRASRERRDCDQLSGPADAAVGDQDHSGDIPFSNEMKAGLDSAFLVTYGLMYIGGGLLLDRLGTRRGFLCIMIFWSLACASHGLAAA